MSHILRRLPGFAFALTNLIIKFCDLVLRIGECAPILERVELDRAHDGDQRHDADQHDLLQFVLRQLPPVATLHFFTFSLYQHSMVKLTASTTPLALSASLVVRAIERNWISSTSAPKRLSLRNDLRNWSTSNSGRVLEAMPSNCSTRCLDCFGRAGCLPSSPPLSPPVVSVASANLIWV